ncbi:MAG: reverse transcriptase family protein [Sedimenticola sp.]
MNEIQEEISQTSSNNSSNSEDLSNISITETQNNTTETILLDIINSVSDETNTLTPDSTNNSFRRLDNLDQSKINEGLNIMYTNADCLTNKIEELSGTATIENVDIIIVTETLPKNRLNCDIAEIELQISGYTLFGPQISDYTGRGIGIYLKEGLASIQLITTQYTNIEVTSVGIKLQNTDWLLIQCVYRSPNSQGNYMEELAIVLSYDNYNNIKFSHRLVVGDFNFKDIDWDAEQSLHSEIHPATQFLEKVRDSYMFQHVKEATRIRQGESDSILDLIFTNEENMVEKIHYLPPLGKSDHVVLQFTLTLYIDKPISSEQRFNYNKGNYRSINEELQKIDWNEALERSSTNEAWGDFADIIQHNINEHIPVCKVPAKKYDTPWMTRTARETIKNKKRKWIKFINNRSEENRENYEEAKRKVNSETTKAKVEYEKQLATNIKTDERNFWKYVKSKTKTKDTIGNLENENGEIETDCKKRAEILNVFFTSVFTNEDTTNIPDFEERVFESPLINTQITEDEIKKSILKLKVSKSQGPDKCHPKFLVETIESLAKPLTLLYNKSLNESKIPDIWRVANISAIHKKGPKIKAENYRPISLTSVVCKNMERVIKDRITSHMEANNLFTKHQHGFRKGYSCVTQLLEVCEKWTEELDSKNNVDVIFLDFQKAFDSVPHQRLFKKMEGYGIRGKVLKWVMDLLTNRKQRVVLNGESSEWSSVTSGIPQGSVIGPTLFLIFINDMPEVVNNIVKMFADDAKIYARVNTVQEAANLQNDINNLQKWSEKWQLKFNGAKCKHMHLGKDQEFSKYNMKIGDEEKIIQEVNEEKDLGVVMDKNLKFVAHIQTVVKKANRMLGVIKRTFKYIDKEVFLNLYKALVRPHLEYASNVWSVIYKKDATLIENVQRRATRLMKNIRHKTYTERLKSLGIPSLQYRRVRADMVEVYKILTGIDKADKTQLFILNRDTRTRGHSLKLCKKQFRLDIRKHSFSQRTINWWNSLPEEIISAESVNQFKSKLNREWMELNIKFQPDCYIPFSNTTGLFYRDGPERRNVYGPA